MNFQQTMVSKRQKILFRDGQLRPQKKNAVLNHKYKARLERIMLDLQHNFFDLMILTY